MNKKKEFLNLDRPSAVVVICEHDIPEKNYQIKLRFRALHQEPR